MVGERHASSLVEHRVYSSLVKVRHPMGAKATRKWNAAKPRIESEAKPQGI